MLLGLLFQVLQTNKLKCTLQNIAISGVERWGRRKLYRQEQVKHLSLLEKKHKKTSKSLNLAGMGTLKCYGDSRISENGTFSCTPATPWAPFAPPQVWYYGLLIFGLDPTKLKSSIILYVWIRWNQLFKITVRV